MNYVFYYFGKVPRHVEYSLNSVMNSDPDSTIFFCSEEKVSLKNVQHVSPSNIRSDLTKTIHELNYFNKGDQNPLWASSMMRMFYINDLAKSLKLESYVHFDSDVICYKPYKELSPYFDNLKLNITPMMQDFLVFGYSFIPNIDVYNEILNEVAEILNKSDYYEKHFYNGNRLTEMKTLYIAYLQKPELFNLLPVLPGDNIIFDPGSYGQYLGGVHYKKFSKKYINKDHIVGKALENKEIQIFTKNKVPKVEKNGATYELANLHVHKKNLSKFMPKDFSWKTR